MYEEAKWNTATEQARKMVTELSNGEKMYKNKHEFYLLRRAKKIKELCPAYDNSIDLKDFYRLEKALKYVIASDGKTCTWTDLDEEKISTMFDVRGFFLTMDQHDLKTAIDKRYLISVWNF